ncbi:WXG100 family type VII secretion target [Streptomyces sp. NPDC056707]|uniref:WXG100 family type VII secretion target n=1 Tax=Streptomyces sp. NPDC056707 TaxID=3345919 RepID=UPI003698496A
MTTPSTSGQKFSKSYVANMYIAAALENGAQTIQGTRTNVTSSATALAASYGGSDGEAFQQLILGWVSRISKIENGLMSVADTMREHTKTQAAVQSDMVAAIKGQAAQTSS